MNSYPYKDLFKYTTFHLSTLVQDIVTINNISDLIYTTSKLKLNKNPFLFLGQGSNILFYKDLFDGTILLNRINDFTLTQDDSYYYISIGSGFKWVDLVEKLFNLEIYGLENLDLIPSSLGGAVIHNIGAYGAEFSTFCESVDYLDIKSLEFNNLSNSECIFKYRKSIFLDNLNYFIVSVNLRIPKVWKPNLSHNELQIFNVNTVSPYSIREKINSLRKSKLPSTDKFGNVGSFFRNPIISKDQFLEIKALYPSLKGFEIENGVKISAAFLIDKSGLKGYSVNDASVYNFQPLVIINKDKAKAKDIVELAKYIFDTVFDKFKIKLVPEVNFIGKYSKIDSFNFLNKNL
ncbi:MAG: UDP-N-acetylmuramate dehydrogenase [Psittacicella sp.]